MKKTKKIKKSSISSGLPVVTTALIYLMMDYYNAVDLVVGILYTLLAIWWLARVYSMITEDWIDPFEDEKIIRAPEEFHKKNSKWIDRINQAMKEREGKI
jgi:hypothetical protein